jgi:flagellar biosynthetic protein FliQ
MDTGEALEVSREAIWVLLKVGLPLMIITLVVGLAISLVQALTQIQEMTLAFVPKIVIVFGSLVLLLPFMLATLTGFMEHLMDRVAALG